MLFSLLILIAQGFIAYYMWKYWRGTQEPVYFWFFVINVLFFLSNLRPFLF